MTANPSNPRPIFLATRKIKNAYWRAPEATDPASNQPSLAHSAPELHLLIHAGSFREPFPVFRRTSLWANPVCQILVKNTPRRDFWILRVLASMDTSYSMVCRMWCSRIANRRGF